MELLTMSNRDIDRLKVIQNTIDGQFTWPQAGEILALSERQIGRLCAKVRKMATVASFMVSRAVLPTIKYRKAL